ncbi:MAG TPA: hydroxymethylglutaryl-CoA reductase, degradative [Planctomycetota bacterium]|jgi:hydroxymethylglutaryl-CoA reductase
MAESHPKQVTSSGKSSRFPGFYKLSVAERLDKLDAWHPLTPEEKARLRGQSLPLDKADMMIENVVGTFAMPLGVAVNFTINGKDYLVPMAIEETSIVAAAGNSAQLIRENGNLTAKCEATVMEGQIQLTDVPDIAKAINVINEAKARLLGIANEQDRMLVSLGGGARDLYCRKLETEGGPMLIIHLAVDVRDAMGANAVNTMLETLGPLIADMAKGDLHLQIITNLCDKSLTRARFEINVDCLKWSKFTGKQVAERLVRAYQFADADPYRATTHNKGVMNGIDGILIATGNDWRAVEAACHAYAARTGRYRSVTRYHIEGDKLIGEIEIPLAVGMVGGVTKLHPGAAIVLKMMGISKRAELCEVIACAGLLQNLAAMRALVTAGIQKGHMGLHARNVACFAGADGELAVEVAKRLEEEGKVTFDRARQIIEQLRSKK